MDSLSNCKCDEKICNYCRYSECDNHCNHPMPGKALLKCNNGNLGSTSVILLVPPFTQTFNQPISSVTIDNTYLCRKNFLIDFTGILTSNLVSGLFTGTFIFTLFKTCKKSNIRQSIANFNFNFITSLGVLEDRTLKFEYPYCEDQCCDCSVYTLELTSVSSGTSARVEVSVNGMLCVLAVDS